MPAKKRAKVLKWEYCECGCHGHSLNIGPLYYWMFNDLEDSAFSFHLKDGHGISGDLLGRYSSFVDADRAARNHARQKIVALREVINRAARALRV